MKWINVKDRLPEPLLDVLVYTIRGDMKVGYWMNHRDLPSGRLWNIAGHSGGIGTSMEVKPPLYWMELPPPPNNGVNADPEGRALANIEDVA